MPNGVKIDTMVKLGVSIDFYETHNSKSFKIIYRIVFTETLIVMEGKLSDNSQHWVNDISTLLGVKFDTTVILVLKCPMLQYSNTCRPTFQHLKLGTLLFGISHMAVCRIFRLASFLTLAAAERIWSRAFSSFRFTSTAPPPVLPASLLESRDRRERPTGASASRSTSQETKESCVSWKNPSCYPAPSSDPNASADLQVLAIEAFRHDSSLRATQRRQGYSFILIFTSNLKIESRSRIRNFHSNSRFKI